DAVRGGDRRPDARVRAGAGELPSPGPPLRGRALGGAGLRFPAVRLRGRAWGGAFLSAACGGLRPLLLRGLFGGNSRDLGGDAGDAASAVTEEPRHRRGSHRGEDTDRGRRMGRGHGAYARHVLRGRGPGAGGRPDPRHRRGRPRGVPSRAARFLPPLPEKGVPV
ncbi:MAG: Na(+) H(+) antiporter subunit E, partial [uncultured Rubrobacteraceae bacterium]